MLLFEGVGGGGNELIHMINISQAPVASEPLSNVSLDFDIQDNFAGKVSKNLYT